MGFFQFVFDNDYFNVASISGHNTFHSMGGVGYVTPDPGRSRHTIKRSTKLVKVDVTGQFSKVAIKAYKKPFVSALSCIKISSLFPYELNPRIQKLSFALDQLWMASMTLPDANPNLGAPSPSWGGFMQVASKGEICEQTRIEILPFINLQPTNPSSIYTALNFVRKQSSLHGMETCFVTFDQPLYAKAIEIVASDEILQGVVVMHKTKESLSALHKAIIGQKPVDLEDEKVTQTLIEKNQQWIITEKERSRTERLWLNYMEQVSLIKLFIYAERTGDWALHLNSIRQIIPYFHAAGHLAYAKSARIYLQQMQALQSTMNETEFGKFTKTGYFTIRRKDNLWGGIFSDQSIEQNLMRLLKTLGGITRGQGITDSSLAMLVHAFPYCIPIC
ncbi:hypothetical protein CAPTEDRAFT_216916 [Capitella teleta]|uniref:Uncharacterized protein n=1 Tax=Capitella teleta TaxID=283909 RepID=R7UQS7_CAPTE|nr:hypothetical protein CAPTEDRAFT_216916 [Capitella teleta]|eukprot:ELU05771.1 hypothetical protein CAPTEDRAFT_216916 [Capitella teleta]